MITPLRLLSLAAFAACVPPACQTATPAPDRFAEVDVNADGQLTAAEISDQYVTGIFKERDTNADGFITRADWNPRITAEESRLFSARDSNKDGRVTLEEAKAHALKAGLYTSMLKEADSDGSGTINRPEAMRYYASKEGPLR